MIYKLESDSSDKSDSEDEFPKASADPDLAGPDLINLDSEMETDFNASSSERSNQPVVNMKVQPDDSEASPAADMESPDSRPGVRRQILVHLIQRGQTSQRSI